MKQNKHHRSNKGTAPQNNSMITEDSCENEVNSYTTVGVPSADDPDSPGGSSLPPSPSSSARPNTTAATRTEAKARCRRRCYFYLILTIVASTIALAAFTAVYFISHANASKQNIEDSSASSNAPPPNSPDSPPNNATGNTTFSFNSSPTPPLQPSTSAPTLAPSFGPSGLATSAPSTSFPSPPLSESPSAIPTSALEGRTTTFMAMGDVPYDLRQKENFVYQIQNMPSTPDFVVHVGDLRNASDDLICYMEEYTQVSDILRQSPIPVFVLLGDNDWNDCPNSDEGLQYWKKDFLFFESRYWNHTFNITRQPDREENFSFRHKGTLFIGLNLVGGNVLNATEWENRLVSQLNWTQDLVRAYVADVAPATGRVVLFGHADPSQHHKAFFDPLATFIGTELGNMLPFLYLNGDKHQWDYEENYKDQAGFLRIMLVGGTADPPLKVTIESTGTFETPAAAFVYDRDQANRNVWNSPPVTAF